MNKDIKIYPKDKRNPFDDPQVGDIVEFNGIIRSISGLSTFSGKIAVCYHYEIIGPVRQYRKRCWVSLDTWQQHGKKGCIISLWDDVEEIGGGSMNDEELEKRNR